MEIAITVGGASDLFYSLRQVIHKRNRIPDRSRQLSQAAVTAPRRLE
jgi:hypothetical protein